MSQLVNPLYVEDTHDLVPSESNRPPTAQSTSDNNTTEYVRTSALREDAVTVLRQDPDFIRSILVSVRSAGHCHRENRNALTPIPEGKVDFVPSPIWPPNDDESSYTDDVATRVYKSQLRYKHKRWRYDKSVAVDDSMGLHSAYYCASKQKSLPEILRELSASINNAMAKADRLEIPPEAVLRSLREKFDKCLDPLSTDAAANAVAACCAAAEDVRHDRAIATLNKALSITNSLNDRSQNDKNMEKGRLTLLKRLGRFTTTNVEPYYGHIQRSSSSSSSSASSGASTSGFSDLTHTPASSNSSASDSPPLANRSLECANVPKTIPASSSHGKNTVGAAITAYDGNLAASRDGDSALKTNPNPNAVTFGGFQCRLFTGNGGSFTNLSIGNGTRESTFAFVQKTVDSFVENGGNSTLLSSYPGHRCPDFTLDVQQAEKVMKKIQERKKERCWCRVITSFVGFAFLLFSVMFFSMMLTRGEKMFGSL